jgi:hypothetical protein
MKTLTRACLTLALLLAPTVGCSKKGEESAPQQKAVNSTLLDEKLLQKLPDGTAGFIVFDFAGEGYKKLSASPWANDLQGLGTIKAVAELQANGATDEQVKVAKTLLDSLQKLGLVSPDGKSQVGTIISSAVGFAVVRKGEKLPLDVGVFVRAAAGAKLTDQVPALKAILSEAGLKTSEQKIGDVQGFKAEFMSEEPAAVDLALHVAGNADTLGISLSKASLEGLFSDKSTNGLATLSALPDFGKAADSVRSPEAPLSFAFVSIKSLSPLTENQGGEGEEDSFDLKDAPVSAIAVSQGFGGQMVTSAGITVSPTNDIQKNILSAFENSGLPATAFKLPADTAVALSLDARIINKLESVLKGLDDPSTAMAIEQLKNIQGITLGLRSGDGASPVPDLYLALDSSTRDEVASTVEAGIGLGMMATGQQLQWLSKDIGGSPTRYFLTPLGVGVYVSSPKNSSSLIVATSERAVQDISSSNGNGASLDTAMSKGLRERVPAATTVGSLYLNFIQLGNLIESVKGTVTSLMGPNPELDKALDATRIKKFGVGIGSLSYANGVFKIQSAFERSEAN